MKKLIAPCLISLLLLACNKDQKVVNKLEGTWRVTNVDIFDFSGEPAFTVIGETFSFSKCDVGESFCNGHRVFGDLTFFKYSVEEKGRRLILFVDNGTSLPDRDEFFITRLSKTVLNLENANSISNIHATLVKQ